MWNTETVSENSFITSSEKAQTLCSNFFEIEEVCTLKTDQFAKEKLELLDTKLKSISDFIDCITDINEKAEVLNTFLESIQMTEKNIGIAVNTPGAAFSFYNTKKMERIAHKAPVSNIEGT